MPAVSSISNFKTFGLKLLLFVVLFFTIDFCFDFGMQYIVKNSKVGKFAGDINTLIKSKSDIIVLGDSRATCHYNPKIITKELELSFFNGGNVAVKFLYILTKINLILEKYTPKVVVIDYSLKSLAVNPYEKFSDLNVYYKQNAVWEQIKNKSFLERYYFLIKGYAYNSKFIHLLMYYFKPNLQSTYKGYFPKTGNKVKGLPEDINSTNLNKKAVNYFCKILDTLHSKNIQIVLVNSPYYGNIKGELPKEVKSRIKKYNAITFNYINFIKNKNLFYDKKHLNKKGAEIFSKKFAEDLKLSLSTK